MKRNLFLFAILVSLLTAQLAAGQSKDGSEKRKACPFSITGLWKSEVTHALTPTFFLFLDNGWVRLMEQPEDALPQDFEIVAEIEYKLDKPAAPKRLEFMARRGNDVFPPGTNSMQIMGYDEDSFITVSASSGQPIQWKRVQTHRYFITFAARGGKVPQGGPAFVMLTTMDGRMDKIEAIGLQPAKNDAGLIAPEFGLISAELYDQFVMESDKKSDVMMRMELTEAEFEKTHKVFEVWEKRIKEKTLTTDDPYLNAMGFLKETSRSLDGCSRKVELPEIDQLQSGSSSGQQMFERLIDYIKTLRKKNDKQHITNALFPLGWRPLQTLPGR